MYLNFFGNIFYLRWCKGMSAFKMLQLNYAFHCPSPFSAVSTWTPFQELFICAALPLPMQNWHSIHPFVPQLFQPRLLYIISSHKTPCCQECDRINVRLYHSPASPLPFFSQLCAAAHTRLVFPLWLGVTGYNKVETVDCRVCAIQLAMPST